MTSSSISATLGGGGAGGGFALGPLPNEFTTVALRNAQYVADDDWAALYNGDRSFWVRVAGADVYRRNAAGNAWEAVTPVVSGPVGPVGPSASLSRTGALPQSLSGNIDWDNVTNAGFYTVATGAVQNNTPTGVVLGACHVFTSQTYAVQIGWTFELSARTFTRTRPGGATVPWNGWERIHIPIDAIVELLNARTGDDRLLITSLRGTIPVSMLPSEVMLDSEFTTAAVQGLLGLTEDEVNDLFTNATITGQVITYTQNDGTVVTITVPVAMGGMADGVVASAMLVGTVLTLTLSTGTTVEVDLAALQSMGGGITLAVALAAILPGTNVTIDRTTTGQITINSSGGGTPPVSDHTRVAVVSPDLNFNASEIAAGTTSMTTAITLPAWDNGTRYLLFLQPEDEDEYTDMRPQGSPFNARASFDIQSSTLTYNSSEHRAYLYDDQLLQRSSEEVWELS